MELHGSRSSWPPHKRSLNVTRYRLFLRKLVPSFGSEIHFVVFMSTYNIFRLPLQSFIPHKIHFTVTSEIKYLCWPQKNVFKFSAVNEDYLLKCIIVNTKGWLHSVVFRLPILHVVCVQLPIKSLCRPLSALCDHVRVCVRLYMTCCARACMGGNEQTTRDVGETASLFGTLDDPDVVPCDGQ